jgi:hypothetical protein
MGKGRELLRKGNIKDSLRSCINQFFSKKDSSWWIVIDRISINPILILLNFDKQFELECDVCGVGIKGILS